MRQVSLTGRSEGDETSSGWSSLERQACLLEVVKAKRVVFITGAGISCSAGIPDFASADGFYGKNSSLLSALTKIDDERALGQVKMRDIFSANIHRSTSGALLFRRVMAELYRLSSASKATLTHQLIGHFARLDRLTRCYTQNIDGLESQIPHLHAHQHEASEMKRKCVKANVIPLHGSLAQMRCTLCAWVGAWSPDRLDVMSKGEAVACPACSERGDLRAQRGQREVSIGLLRPDIILYDEYHHQSSDVISKCLTTDLAKSPELVIIMGTSLKIPSVRRMIQDFSKKARKVIFVNKTAPPADIKSTITLWIQGNCDEFARQVIDLWQERRPEDWSNQSVLTLVSQVRILANVSEKPKKVKALKSVVDKENERPMAIVKCIRGVDRVESPLRSSIR